MKITATYSIEDSELLAADIAPGVIVNSIGGITRKDRVSRRLKKLLTTQTITVRDEAAQDAAKLSEFLNSP